MSYLLDALRRSEEERRRGETPDLSTRHGVRTVRRRRRDGTGLIVAVALALALAAFAGGVLWQRTSLGGPEPAAAPAPVDPPPARTASASAPAARAPAEARRATAPEPPGPQPSAPATAAPPSRSAAAVTGPVPLAALSPELRRRLPALELTTHVFARDPALREVAVDGVVYREGDRIGQLVLERITEDGVVVRLDDTRVAIGVLEAWGF